MADVKSKNLYELLGNTSDQDSDREPDPPTKTVDKTTTRHGKRDAPKAAPAEAAVNTNRGGRRGGRAGGFTGSEAAFRERATGRTYNRDQPTGEGEDTRPGRNQDRGRGRGRYGPRRGGDRHSRTGVADHPKQEGHGWGESTGNGEWADEKAGDAIASQEVKEAAAEGDGAAEAVENGEAATAAEPEPEDNSKSYADYLAEQAAKKLESLGLKEARAPNEGAKENKKWKSAKELSKDDTENYFVGGDDKGKAARDRQRAAKEFVDIDYTFREPARETRGGRGGRGGRGRGEFRGRGDREGGFRGGRGRGGERGEFRGGRGRGRGDNFNVAVNDETAFPSLGGK